MAVFPSGTSALYRWKASDIALADNTEIDSWPAATGGVALSGTTSTRPTLQTNELNGKSVVRFDGAGDVAFTGDTAFTSTAQPITWYVALNQSSAATSGLRQVMFFDGDGGSNSLECLIDAGVRHTWGGSGYPAFGSQTADTWTVWTLTFASGTATSYLNGSADGSPGSTGAAATGTKLLVGGHRSDFRPFGGDIAEIVVCTGAHDATIRASVHSYMQDEYGITVTDYVAASVYDPPTGLPTNIPVNPGSGVQLVASAAPRKD